MLDTTRIPAGYTGGMLLLTRSPNKKQIGIKSEVNKNKANIMPDVYTDLHNYRYVNNILV
jgi:hypothetical protein